MSSVPRSKKCKQGRYQNRSYLHHLEDLILLVKCLYPHRTVVNPYEEFIYNQSWTKSYKQLVLGLIQALTILNQKYRTEDKWYRIHACNEDFISALMLVERGLEVKKPKVLLNPSDRNLYSRLVEKYGEQPFSCRDAMLAHRIAKTTAHWKIRELISKGFVKLSHKEGQKHYYIISRSGDEQ